MPMDKSNNNSRHLHVRKTGGITQLEQQEQSRSFEESVFQGVDVRLDTNTPSNAWEDQIDREHSPDRSEEPGKEPATRRSSMTNCHHCRQHPSSSEIDANNLHLNNEEFPFLRLFDGDGQQPPPPDFMFDGRHSPDMIPAILPSHYYPFFVQPWMYPQPLIFSLPYYQYMAPSFHALPPPLPSPAGYAPWTNPRMMGNPLPPPPGVAGQWYPYPLDERGHMDPGGSSSSSPPQPPSLPPPPPPRSSDNPAAGASGQHHQDPAAFEGDRHQHSSSQKQPRPIYQCRAGRCYYLFTRRSDRDRHEVVHDPYRIGLACEACGRTFTRRDTMLRHKTKTCPGLQSVQRQ